MRRIFLGLLFATVWSWGAAAETRLALVIGNQAYRPEVGALSEPYSDADRVAAALTDLGFQVTPVRDASNVKLREAIASFVELVRRSGPDTISVIYYSGHGASGGPDADTYLIPTDAGELSTATLPVYGYKLDSLLDALSPTSAKAHVVLIDACRNVPVKGAKGGHKGVASVAPRRGMLIGFSAEHGTTAEDAPHYSTALAAALTQPGIDLGVAMRNVSYTVRRQTGGKQFPEQLDRLSAPLYLSALRETPPVDPCAAAPVRAGYSCTVQNGVAMLIPDDVTPPPPPPPPPPFAPFGIAASAWIEGGPGAPGSVFRERAEAPEMVVIPAGSFTMGSPESETTAFSETAEYADRERPQRQITIPAPFALARHEVTVGEFRRFIRETGHQTGDSCITYENGEVAARSPRGWDSPGFGQGEDHPALCVNWEDAQAYIRWLNTKTAGAPYRLPSEAEWEYAARAGSSTARHWGDDATGARQCGFANGADAAMNRVYPEFGVADCDDGYAQTAPVGRFGRNGFGLSDMLGNALEWVEDCFRADLSGLASDASAYSQQSCGQRVLRGGSWNVIPRNLRSAGRYWLGPGNRNDLVGFRLARTLTL